MAKLVSTLLIQESPTVRRKIRGEYDAFTPKEKARIARYASEIGVTRAIRKHTLKESSVRTWTNKYKEEMKRNSVTGVHAITTKLENRKRGRPLLLGNELDEQEKMYITALRSNGAVVNSAIVMVCAEGLVKSHDSNLLQANGGHIAITKPWAQSLLRMGYVKRKATTKAKVPVSKFDGAKGSIFI